MSAAAASRLISQALAECGLSDTFAEEIHALLSEEDFIGSASDIFNAVDGQAELSSEKLSNFSTALFEILSREQNRSLPHKKRHRPGGLPRVAATAAANSTCAAAAPTMAAAASPVLSRSCRGTQMGAPVGTIHGASSASAAEFSALERLAWKREFKSTQERFHSPYEHVLERAGDPEGGAVLTLAQEPFGPEGFASTVWDSSIVLARAAERWHANGTRHLTGVRCIELGAGCGLVGFVFGLLGASVTLTDLPENLPLLERNASANAAALAAADVSVAPLVWGSQPPAELLTALHTKEPAAEEPPPALILATDVFYSFDAIPLLVQTLEELATPSVECWLAAGRNRRAATAFFAAVESAWRVEQLTHGELHPLYQADDVDVWRLSRRRDSACRDA